MRLLAALLLALAPAAQTAGPPRAGMLQKGFELVGYVDLKGGEYGDLTTLGSTAYVGTRCGPQNVGGAGVKVASFADPRHPKPLSTLAAPPLTRAEDVAVRHVQTTGFRGDLALVGLQTCKAPGRPDARTGFRLFDVTKPAAPVLLSEWLLPEGAVGCHEVDLVQRADGRILAACARNLLDQYDPQTRAQTMPAVQLVDVTDPHHPTEILAWSKTVVPFSGIGCLPVKFAHSARFENRGQTLYVSYWDAGTILLDLADPSPPGRGGHRPDPDAGPRQPLDDDRQRRPLAGDQPRGLLAVGVRDELGRLRHRLGLRQRRPDAPEARRLVRHRGRREERDERPVHGAQQRAVEGTRARVLLVRRRDRPLDARREGPRSPARAVRSRPQAWHGRPRLGRRAGAREEPRAAVGHAHRAVDRAADRRGVNEAGPPA